MSATNDLVSNRIRPNSNGGKKKHFVVLTKKICSTERYKSPFYCISNTVLHPPCTVTDRSSI